MRLPDEFEFGTSSGFGWHFWKSFLECPRKARLQEQGPAARIGSYFHKLTEIYDLEEENKYELEYQVMNSNPEWETAIKLYSAWTEKFPRREPGELLGNEKWFEAVKGDEDKCLEKWGVHRLTGQLDRIYRIGEEDAQRLMQTRPELGFLTPGVYITDFKTSGQGGKTWAQKQKLNQQYTVYDALLEDNEPKLYEEFQGTIVFGVIKTKKPYFPSVWVPPAKDVDRKRLRATLALCYKRYLSDGEDAVNPSRCLDFGGCGFLKENGGPCDRY